MDRERFLPNITAEDRKLIKLFQGEVDRINLLYLKAIHSNDITKANQLLKQIKKISKYLTTEYWKRADVRIPQEYVKWSSYIDDVIQTDTAVVQLSQQAVETYLEELWPIHVDAVNALLDNSKNYVRSSLDWMERQALTMINELQQTQVREELAKWVISGEWRMNDRIIDYFTDNGISWFKDRGWKYWSMDRYVDMLVRTETNIANTQGTINRALELWITKFWIVEEPTCCKECAEMNWDIVDIREWTVELPPFHPNCRWYIVAVIWDEAEEEYLMWNEQADFEINDKIQDYYLPKKVREKLPEIENIKTYNDLKEYLKNEWIELTTDLKVLSEEKANEEIDVVRETAQRIALATETYKEVFGEESLSKLKRINLYSSTETSKAAYYYDKLWEESDEFSWTIQFRQWWNTWHEVFHEFAHVLEDSLAKEWVEDALTYSDRIVKENNIKFESSYGTFWETENAEMVAEAISKWFTQHRPDWRDVIMMLRKKK